MNTINLRALFKLSMKLNIKVNELESKLQACNISVKKTESTGFRTNKENRGRFFMGIY